MESPKQKYGFGIGYAKKTLDLAIWTNKVDEFVNQIEYFIESIKAELSDQQENVISMHISDLLWVRHKGQQPNRYKSCGEPQKKKHLSWICHGYVTCILIRFIAFVASMSQLMNNYVKGNGGRITRFGERYYKEFLSIFWKKPVSDYVKIYEKNVAARKANNDAAETLVLLSEMRERANVILRDVDKENKEDKEDYGIEQEM
ncbi:hypothetical protein C1645_738757 [Glomus cerebriforme]|uniref:Uncharacterized protein n=1 Tax=Glomus cerebriforme TaxID=658196 RepID=A0A397SW99_9GLOM|nr:hypothetical protein C1645_738757 [Glomus cerebriforme]